MKRLSREAWDPTRYGSQDENSEQWFLGQNPVMRRVSKHIERASEVECTVLITGETGTGKEVFARLLHEAGPRALRPFVPVNCAALYGYVG